MDHTQPLMAAIANVPTIIIVVIGIVRDQGTFNKMSDCMTSIENRMSSIEYHLVHIDAKLDAI